MRALETVAIAVVGTVLAVLLALPLCVLAARTTTPSGWLRLPVRLFLNGLRGVDAFVFALLFVAAVGLGPFAGVLGIALHTWGSMGKLFAETIEALPAGLLEAAAQCAADGQPVLLVGYDMPAVGALASVTTSRGLLAVALVVAPERTERTVAAFDWSLDPGEATAAAPRSTAAQALAGNAMADALPLFEALADTGAFPATVSMPLRWEELDEAQPGDFTVRTVPGIVADRGDAWATLGERPGNLSVLLEWWERDVANGQGEMPYPPDYPKMPGEPPRVQPSRINPKNWAAAEPAADA